MKVHICNRTGRPFKRGARPTSRGKLAAALPFRKVNTVLTSCFIFPVSMNMLGNDENGDCVTAEEGYNKQCNGINISYQTAVTWASNNGDLNGADLEPVIQQMQAGGFSQDGNTYGDGSPLSVDYTDLPTLQAAIYQAAQQGGCVKFGIAADCLPSTAGNNNGWTLSAAPSDSNEDHCMGASGFGTVSQFIAAVNACYGLSLPVPTTDDSGSPISPTDQGIAVYTWSTVGWMSYAGAFINVVGEAWLRNPSSVNTIIGPPAPDQVYSTLGPTPTPPPPPIPPIPPTPGALATLTVSGTLAPGTYQVVAAVTPTSGFTITSTDGAAILTMAAEIAAQQKK